MIQSFREFIDNNLCVLVESLDKPYQLTDVTDSISPENIKKTADRGYSDMKFYGCEDRTNQAFFVGKKQNAYEVHHQHIIDGQQIIDKNVLDKPPSRFVSTAFHLAHNKLRTGNKVRIVAPDIHINHYHNLAKLIANRKGYVVDEPQRDSDGRNTFLIHPPEKTSPIDFRIIR